MWDKIWGYIKQVFSMGHRLDDAEEDISGHSEELKELRKEDKDLNAKAVRHCV